MTTTFIDSSYFIQSLNEYRLQKNLRLLRCSCFLSELSREHCKMMIQAEIPFGLDNWQIRKAKLSISSKCTCEIIARYNLPKNDLQYLLENEGTKKILEANFDMYGITIYDIGLVRHIHIIVLEQF